MLFPLHLQKVAVGNENVELFVPDAEAVRKAYQPAQLTFPYWSRVWPAAIALSNFMLAHPHLVRNTFILELGAGLGLPSLVAARFANRVLCTDGVPEALQVVAQSAAKLHLSNIETAVTDWKDAPVQKDVEVLLLSDVAYDPSAFSGLLKLIAAYLGNETVVLLSLPQRLQSKAFVLPLSHHCVQQKEYRITDHGSTAVNVMVLKGT